MDFHVKHNFDDFKRKLDNLDITYTDEQLFQFEKYYELLVEWNSFMNLTGITEWDEVLEKHYLDSICLVYSEEFKKIVKNKQSVKMIDIGTGAGFPGIPLKIMFPYLDITLLDSLNKRVKFLNHVIDELGLDNICTIHGRAEDFGRDKKYREQYDFCVSRAVANLSTLSEYAIPFVKKDGFFIAYKTEQSIDEINNSENAIKLLGGNKANCISFKLPDSDIGRVLCEIKKNRETDKKYPRKAGVPQNDPL